MLSVKLVDTFCEGTYMKPVRTIGIVNGGGDAPGLNAVIRAVVRSAIYDHGMRVIGIRNGFDGLIWPEGAKELTEESVSGILPVAARFLAPPIAAILSPTNPWKMARNSFTTTLPCAWRMPGASVSTP
jgi:hypothetical protein